MISVNNLTIAQGEFVLRDVQLTVPDGQYGVLMGRTGCGKTTVLEAICGLRPLDSGSIILSGQEVTSLSPAARGVGYVPQDGALFATMTVREHLAFALKIRKVDAAATAQRISELAELLGIEQLLHRQPCDLSGGERQRVALGRAISFNPSALLLDEPLSALDDETRFQMYDVLHRVRRHTGVTALHVTHSRAEAEELADVLFVFHNGDIQQRPLSRDA